MKSFFTKLGGLLLCGVMFTAVGCHDYAEDIKDVNDRLDKIDGVLSGDSEGVAKDLAALKATVAALDATYATEAELEKAVGDLQTALEGKVSAAVKEANDAVAALQAAVAEKADKSELTAKETELLAKINELKSAMETAKTEMQTALAGLDAKYAKVDVYNKIAEINTTLAGLGDIYLTKETFNTEKAALQTLMTALEGRVSAVEGSIDTLEEALESKVGAVETAVKVVADKVAALETTVGTIETSLAEAKTAIETNKTAIEGVKENLATEVKDLEDAIALKADKTAVEAIDTDLKTLTATVNTLSTTVALKANQADLEAAKDTLKAAIAAKADACVVDALEDRVETIEGNIDALKDSLAAAQARLDAAIALKADKTALDEVKTTLQSAIDAKVSQEDYDAKVEELNSAIAAKVAKVDFDKAISTLQGSIDKLAEENKEAHESLHNYAAEVKKEMREQVASFNEEIKKLHEQIDALQAELKKLSESYSVSADEIAQLFARIQSVVFRPEYADGKAHVSYAMAGNTTLEGYSYVTYKVFPASCAETIAAAINQKEGTPALTVSFDAFKAKSSNTEFIDVISADSDADGCLTIEYKANFGADFYSDDKGYNAALVLAETREDNPQIFSTEYTNFVADASLANNWNIALYVGNTPYAEYIKLAENEAYTNVTWPFVAVGKEYQKEILPGVTPKFVATIDNETVVKTPEEFAALGYDAAYTVATTVEYPDSSLPEQVISVGIYEDEAMASLVPTLVNKANVDDPNAQATVKKTFVWTVSGEDAFAEATLDVVEFPYELAIETVGNGKYARIEYVNKDAKVTPLYGDFGSVTLSFVDKDGKPMLDEEGNAMTADDVLKKYPAIKIASTVSFGSSQNPAFNITPYSEEYAYPLTVSLADDVTFENVDDALWVVYKFQAPLLGDAEPLKATAGVRITGMEYNYTITPAKRVWNYTEDAKVDAGEQAQYCFAAEIKLDEAKSDKIVVDDVALSQALQRGNPKYTGVKYEITDVTDAANPVVLQEDSYVLDLGAEDNSSIVKVKFLGMEFNKKYLITAYNSIEREKKDLTKVAAAEVFVTFELETVKSLPELTLALDKSTYELAANLIITDQISDEVNDELLNKLVADFTEETRGANFDVAKWYEDVFVTNFNSDEAVNSLEFGETSISGIKSNNILDVTADAIYTQYNYASKHFAGVTIPTSLTYTKVIETYYGQKVTITKPLEFTLPEYTLVHSEYLVDNVDGAYQSYIQPSWTYNGNKVNGFTVQSINLNDAFLLKKGETVLSKEDQKTASLDLVFSTPTGEGLPTISANVMTYNSPADTAPVSAGLFLVNTKDGAEYNRVALPIANAEEYAGYFVNKYDPLGDLAAKATLTEQVVGKATYSVNVAKALNLKDKLGNDFVKDGAITSAYDYSSNFFGIVMSADIDAAKASVPVEWKANVTFTRVPADETLPLEDYEVTFDNTTELQMLKDLEVKVPVKLTYTWGETETEITVKFLAPVK